MIKFDSDVGSFSTFDDVGAAFIKLMGHSGTVPSAIDADGIQGALTNLQRGLGTLPPEDRADAPANDDDDDDAPKVPLARRATALVTLLEDALKQGSGIRWRAT